MSKQTAPNDAERSSRSFRLVRYDADERAQRRAEHAQELGGLSEQCRMLRAHLHNTDDDPELVFADFTFPEVAAAAAADSDVFLALRRLSDAQLRRLLRRTA